MPKNSELIGEYLQERYRFENANGDVIIGTVVSQDGGPVAVKGTDLTEGFATGRTYRFFGHWKDYRGQPQFAFNSAVETSPMSSLGAVRYLQRVKGIGVQLSNMLWDKYEEKVFDYLRDHPATVIADIPIKKEVLEEATAFFTMMQAQEQTTIELIGLLDGKGFPKATLNRALREWGVNAPHIIRKNPYAMMTFPGVGFKRCDQLYLQMHLPPGALKRQAYCSWYGVHEEVSRTGSTWVQDAHGLAAVKGLISGTEAVPRKAIKLALRAGILESEYADENGLNWDGDVRYLANSSAAWSERRLGELIVEAMQDEPQLPTWTGSASLSDHQFKATDYLLNERAGCVRILGGGPGTGKTFTLSELVKWLKKRMALDQIALAAPTGKAAVRITESLAAAGIKKRATTWHSLLEYQPGGGFARDETNPLPYRVVIGDEQSMQDTAMACNAFKARGKGCLYFLIGDVNQLPPVSHGAPLRDMIEAGVPYRELTEVRRNAGEIVLQCRNMRENGRIEVPRWRESEGKNLELVSARDESQQVNAMVGLLQQYNDPTGHCQVLVPTNKSSQLGRKALNQVLQNQLNSTPVIKGSPFRLDDKVVCLRNGWCSAIDYDDDAIVKDGSVYVANGEIGFVIESQPRLMHVVLSDPYRQVKIPRGAVNASDDPDDRDSIVKPDEVIETGCNWDLAYALSVHKAQGSEMPVVIVMLDESGGARQVCSREYLYTAISRAKEKCYLIGKASVAEEMVRQSKINDRKTFLVERIRNESGALACQK